MVKKTLVLLVVVAIIVLAMAVPAMAAPGGNGNGAPAQHNVYGPGFGALVSDLAQMYPGAVAVHLGH